MRYAIILASLAAFAVATPAPLPVAQNIPDFSASKPLAKHEAPIGNSSSLGKRAPVPAPVCATLPSGSGPIIRPDTPEAFLASTRLAGIAKGEETPRGYVRTFKNLQASSEAMGYLGYTAMRDYEPCRCAELCDATFGCSGFNIYFERDPTLEDSPLCPNPPSTTVIKCVLWGGAVIPETATNVGQMRQRFRVVIAGSNGYMNQQVKKVDGFKGAFLDNKAINAPTDCNGADSYMTSKLFDDGAPFSADRCRAACDAANQFEIDHPSQQGKICRFFNTYIVYRNGRPLGQNCALYTENWADSYATNVGQTRSDGVYTISHSFSYYKASDPGACQPAHSSSSHNSHNPPPRTH